MASDRQYLKINWNFSIISTDEVATTGLAFSLLAGTSFDAEAALAEIVTATTGAALATRMQTLLASTSLLWANYSQLVSVRMAAVGTDGLELAAPKIHTVAGTVIGDNVNVLPQSTIVVSLRSMQFGPGANYGRMYLPHTSFNLNTGTPIADSNDVILVATAADTFVEGCQTDLNAALTEVVDAMIISHITGRESRGVASIAVGNVVDTQRRRRNQLNEVYAFRAITP